MLPVPVPNLAQARENIQQIRNEAGLEARPPQEHECWCCGGTLPPYSGKSKYWKSTLTYYCPDCDVTGTTDSDRPRSERFAYADRPEQNRDPETDAYRLVRVPYVDFSAPGQFVSSPA